MYVRAETVLQFFVLSTETDTAPPKTILSESDATLHDLMLVPRAVINISAGDSRERLELNPELLDLVEPLCIT